MVRKFFQKLLIASLIVVIVTVTADFGSGNVRAAQTIKVRREINILNGYKGSPSGTYATSSSRINFDPADYSDAHFYFEIVASTTSAVSSTIYLKEADTYQTVASIVFSNANTYTLYRSAEFAPLSGAHDYVIVIGNEAVQKGAQVARIVILQNSTQLTKTASQVEIGNRELDKSNTDTQALQYPKYWLYTATNWDGSPVFEAGVTYQNTQAASSTLYTTATTTTSTYTYIVSDTATQTIIEAWGAGGGGQGGTTSTGGGGGGGGAYARSTTTFAVGSSHDLSVPRGGPADTASAAGSATFDTTFVVAAGGTGTSNATGGAGGTTAASTGQVEFAGGNGGAGTGTSDTGGGGGGAAGTNGAGGNGATAPSSTGGGGGGGNGGSNSTTVTGGASTNGGAGGNGSSSGNGQAGKNHPNGGGGGGGSISVTQGGAGGYPGGGGGGSDTNVTGNNTVGGAGQIKITETAGGVNVCLEEDDGSFNFTCKTMIVQNGVSTSTSARQRVTFTPTDGRHYRITASTTLGTYSIYNSKIIVSQTNPTKFETQYLVANTLLSPGTALQKFMTKWDPQEWNTNNTYFHEANSVSGGTSVIKLQNIAGPTDVTNSIISNVVQRSRSSALSMPATAATLDTISTTNNNNLYVSRILVLVTLPAAASEGSGSASRSFLGLVGARMKMMGGRLIFR